MLQIESVSCRWFISKLQSLSCFHFMDIGQQMLIFAFKFIFFWKIFFMIAIECILYYVLLPMDYINCCYWSTILNKHENIANQTAAAAAENSLKKKNWDEHLILCALM